MRSRGSPCHGPSGEIIRWYGSLENIDEHKQKEVALERFQSWCTVCGQSQNGCPAATCSGTALGKRQALLPAFFDPQNVAS